MPLEDNLYPLLRLYEASPQSVKSFAGRMYRALPQRLRLGPAHERFQGEAAASEHWTTDEIQAYQIEAIRETLDAAQHCPWYQQAFQRLGLNPNKFDSLDQLSRYPLLTKDALRTHGEALISTAFPASDRLALTTGGSTGEPVEFQLHKGISRPKEQAYLEAQWMRRGYKIGDRVALLRGHSVNRHDPNAIHYHDATRNWLVLSSSHLTANRLHEYVAALSSYQPQHLHAYPSSALLLKRLLEQTGMRLDFPLTSLLCGSERLTSEEQSELQDFFEAPVCHWYGHSERVVFAGQGHRSDHLFFWPGYGFAELGPENEDGLCEVIGTSFHNRVMPLIRYRTGDRVAAASVKNQEHPGLEINAVDGRDHEFLISQTGRRVSLTTLNRHDNVFEGVLATQYEQHTAGDVTLCLQTGPLFDPQRRSQIHTAVMQQLGSGFSLTVDCRSELGRTSSGKHRPMIRTVEP